jgi:hypothetical protein
MSVGTQRFYQTITLTNTGGSPISGPVSLALDNLSSNATLFNTIGSTSCAAPIGSPFLDAGVDTMALGLIGAAVMVWRRFRKS